MKKVITSVFLSFLLISCSQPNPNNEYNKLPINNTNLSNTMKKPTPEPTITPTLTPSSLEIVQTAPEITDMVFVVGGTFKMGNNEGSKIEKLVHDVTLSSFYIGKYKVTEKEFKTLTNSSLVRNSRDNFPITDFGWLDMIKFCNLKSKAEGLPIAYNEKTGELLDINGKETTDITKVIGYRLPTEAEWEYAARGGNKTHGYKYSGSNSFIEVSNNAYKESSDYYWNEGSFSGDYSKELGTTKANELRIYDMSGYTGEWCQDLFYSAYYEKSPSVNPVCTETFDKVKAGFIIPFIAIISPWEETSNFRVVRSYNSYSAPYTTENSTSEPTITNRHYNPPEAGGQSLRLARSYSSFSVPAIETPSLAQENSNFRTKDEKIKFWQCVVNNFKSKTPTDYHTLGEIYNGFNKFLFLDERILIQPQGRLEIQQKEKYDEFERKYISYCPEPNVNTMAPTKVNEGILEYSCNAENFLKYPVFGDIPFHKKDDENSGINIINNSGQKVKINWLDNMGKRNVFYIPLANKEKYFKNDWFRYPLIITDENDKCLKIFTVPNGFANVYDINL